MFRWSLSAKNRQIILYQKIPFQNGLNTMSAGRAYRWILFSLLLVPVAVAQTEGSDRFGKIADAAIEQTKAVVIYDPAYRSIPYPNGDIPPDRGVCADVIIRAYRAVGIDLQQEVHEDMARNFSKYPKKWGLRGPDTNIDHRRVPNLMTFFTRRRAELPVSARAEDYRRGDVVAWDLGGGVTHIGIVARDGSKDVVHNIGAGPKLEPVLFDWKIIGRYRYPQAH